MEKLELKHLAPYLPYGVLFRGKRVGWAHSDANHMVLCPIDLDGRFEWIKPILRPLSDLTDEMAVSCRYKDKVALKLMIVSGNIPYNGMQNLFMHHYDVFGLIKKRFSY